MNWEIFKPPMSYDFCRRKRYRTGKGDNAQRPGVYFTGRFDLETTGDTKKGNGILVFDLQQLIPSTIVGKTSLE